jgi:hypothetical protein
MTITTRDFCLWLDSVLDERALTAEQTAAIRQRLSDVFLHEIDPAMGDDTHQDALNRIHRGVH